jgi:DNA-binding transcriptional LysR family regulator
METLRLGHIKIRQLQLLAYLSEGHTLSSAAQQLHLTVPAVSQMLKELESLAGAALFARSTWSRT